MRLYLFQMALLPTNGTPAVSYLIQTDDGTNVLVDTGFPKNFEAPSMDLQLDDRDYIVAQLAGLGFTPSDVVLL